jgi:hypothetical protein
MPFTSVIGGVKLTHVWTEPATCVVRWKWPQIVTPGSVAWSRHGDPLVGSDGRKFVPSSVPVNLAVVFVELTTPAGGVAAEAAAAHASAVAATTAAAVLRAAAERVIEA